jgi:predicted RNA-binding Zn ribbon-like protein
MSASTGVAGEDASSAVALVNTRHLQSGQPADLLADPARAAGWLTERGLLPRGTALPDPDTARLVALREAVRRLFAAKAGQRVPAVDDVTLLNAALAAAPVVPALTWDEAGPHRREHALAGAGPCTVAIARLARDALRVLTDPAGPEPAPCGAHGCVRWFLRTHAARQWCSDRCGDRVRAARHYARHRGTA